MSSEEQSNSTPGPAEPPIRYYDTHYTGFSSDLYGQMRCEIYGEDLGQHSWLSNREIAVRSSIGFFLFVPPGEDERWLEAAGLKLLAAQDLTETMAVIAGHYGKARARREQALREIEGDATYEGQQEFFRVAEQIAWERRLSRFAFLATKPT